VIVAGVASLQLDEVFARAGRHISLYAPPYGNFAFNGAICEGIHSALSSDNGVFLVASIFPPLSRCAWVGEMMHLLRPQADIGAMEEELRASREFLLKLKRTFNGRVMVIEMPFRPSFPAMVVDDMLYFGQFAHAPVLTSEGFWCAVEIHARRLFAMARTGRVPEASAPEERAAFRIVSECVQSWEQGKCVSADAVG